jgi:hypothetical protein
MPYIMAKHMHALQDVCHHIIWYGLFTIYYAMFKAYGIYHIKPYPNYMLHFISWVCKQCNMVCYNHIQIPFVTFIKERAHIIAKWVLNHSL